jgi:hypothetical protein
VNTRLDVEESAQAWINRGSFEIPDDLIDPGTWDSITSEADDLKKYAKSIDFDGFSINRDGSVTTPRMYLGCSGQSAMKKLLRNVDLLQYLRVRAGFPGLIPTRCGFNFYEPGDYLGVHRDNIKSTVTLTAALTAQMDPMMTAPQFREGSNEQILEFARSHGHLPGVGEPVPAVYRKFHAFDGYNIPHWRNVVQDSCILAVLSYFDLY